MATYEELQKQLQEAQSAKLLEQEKNSNVSQLESIVAGIGSGLIQIPKGAVSLAATLYDLGAGTNTAVKFEKMFDDATTWDEKAEATALGRLTQTLVNLGVPGSYGFKLASNLTKEAILAKKAGNYFKLTNPSLIGAAEKAAELNTKGKLATFAAGAIGAGASDAAFVGNVEKMGTIGDLLGGPTELKRGEGDEDYDPSRELINRLKFGTESALMSGVISGVGSGIKKIADRGKELRFSNSKIDRLLDKISSGFTPEGGKTQEFFDIERQQIGKRSADVNLAQEVSKTLDQDIDKLFPPVKTIFDKQTAKQRTETLSKLHDLLISGDPVINDAGRVAFGPLDEGLKNEVTSMLKKAGADGEIIENINNTLSLMRAGWSDMFSAIGNKIDPKDISQFKSLFGEKFKNYLGSTYDIFQNKSIIPMLNWKPAEEAVNKTKNMFKQVAAQNGKELTDEEANYFVDRLLKTAKLPKGFRLDKASDPVFQLPDFFAGNTVLDDAISSRGYTSLSSLPKENREVIEELLGKSKNPIQTILSGTARLSLITRRNQFFQDLLEKSNELKKVGSRGMFYDTEEEALKNLGTDFKKVNIDPNKSLEAGITNPLNGKYAINEIADALEQTAASTRSDNMIGKIYENLILYPKATSQIAKTILSPVTHIRNFISSGAFATANGIIPDIKSMREAYKSLQTGLPGTGKNNEFYRELLELGVVNSNTKIGDLSNLLKDVGFGDTVSSDKVLKLMMKPFSKLKKVGEDLYTAEDDFWKITSYLSEKNRLEKAYIKAGITKSTDELKQEAADIVKNNIPNYDYVGDFVKGLRKLPVGNFMAFPAEILRTSTNIVKRSLDEIFTQVKNDRGELVTPLRGIGMQRLIGMTTTAAVVPYATAEAFKAIYNVADDEIEAMKRYVPQWSKNSVLLPIRDKDGKLKYIDFSHANGYDTIYRPFLTVINAINEGKNDKNGIMDDFVKGIIESTKELGSPFIGESIWTSALADLFVRGGVTKENTRIWNPEDTVGDKIKAGISHLVESQAPFSYDQLKRLDLAIEPIDIIQKGKFDKYGRSYELGDELAGLTGFRPVKLDVERGLDFKIAEFQRGVRESRQLFTSQTLKGGPMTPEEVVDAYINANRALFQVKRNLSQNVKAAQVLGTPSDIINKAGDRISRKEFNTINSDVFTPLHISKEIYKVFQENADKLGQPNPLEQAYPVIANIQNTLMRTSLKRPEIPEIENPFKNLPKPNLNPIQGLPALPNAAQIQGYGQTTLNAAVTGKQVNPATGLTRTETALLSPTEQLIRQDERQKGTV